MIQNSKRIFCALLFLAFFLRSTAPAQETAALSEDQVKERLDFIMNALNSAQPRARTWWYGWISAYSAGAAVQGALAAAHWNDVRTEAGSTNGKEVRDRGFAEDMLVGGATCALGAAGLLIDPFIPAYGPNALRAMSETTPAERLTKLQRAEELLRRCARREKNGRGWLTHLLNIGVNAAAGLTTAAAFHRPWTDGLITFAAGETVSLLTIFTQPRRAIRDLRDYEMLCSGKKGAPTADRQDRNWMFGVFPGGFSVSLSF